MSNGAFPCHSTSERCLAFLDEVFLVPTYLALASCQSLVDISGLLVGSCTSVFVCVCVCVFVCVCVCVFHIRATASTCPSRYRKVPSVVSEQVSVLTLHLTTINALRLS